MVDRQEADLYNVNLETEKEEAFLRKRRYYTHSYLIEKLYEPATEKKFREFYGILNIYSHAEFKGSFKDFPSYYPKGVEESLRINLCLAYGNIQMIAEGLFDFLTPHLKEVIKVVLKDIIGSVGYQVPLFEPDKKKFLSIIKLKRGNFEKVLI